MSDEPYKPTAMMALHQEALAAGRREAVLVFEGGKIFMHLTGPCVENGSGRFIFDEADVEWKPHDEKDGCYLEVKIARSEMIELRDWITKQLEAAAP